MFKILGFILKKKKKIKVLFETISKLQCLKYNFSHRYIEEEAPLKEKIISKPLLSTALIKDSLHRLVFYQMKVVFICFEIERIHFKV